MDEVDATQLLQEQATFWAKQEASVNGMLGGFGHLAEKDAAGSLAFLDSVLPPSARKGRRALDCGAGIGRVTKMLLIPAGFATVDLLDLSADFLALAAADLQDSGRLGRTFACGLAGFDFAVAEQMRWRLVWVQWCAIYLKDAAFVDFFQRAVAALEEGGMIVLKENTLHEADGTPENDLQDSSVTRSDRHLRRLFQQAGLRVVKAKAQKDFPRHLFPVVMYALVPTSAKDTC